MSLFEDTCRRIVSADAGVAATVQNRLDAKTKPRRSLGRLEDLACRVAAARGSAELTQMSKVIIVIGADHGVVEEGVSAYPAEVTYQMLLNFARGGAAINVLARHVGAEVVVVDMGVGRPLASVPGIVSRRVGPGTRNFTRENAMTRAQAITALETGIELATNYARQGFGVIGLGEMGIGNTTSASALVAALMGSTPEEVTGRGTGIDEATFARKVEVIRRGLALHRAAAADDLDILARLGGFEIAGLAGVALGAAAEHVPVVLDGFIASTAALVAARLVPAAGSFFIASHRSVERGHQKVLTTLGLEPLLDLEMRLGEGTGAALAMNLIDAAIAIVLEMATFASAAVTDSGA